MRIKKDTERTPTAVPHARTEPAPPFAVMPNLPLGGACDHDGHPLTFEQALGDGLLRFTSRRTGAVYQIVDLMTGTARLPDVAWLEEQMRSGAFRIVRPRADAGRTSGEARPGLDPDAIDEKDPKARKRLFVVRELLRAGARCSDPDVGLKLDDIWTAEVEQRWGVRPPNGTARRWLRAVLALDEVRLTDVMSMSGRVPRRPSDLRLDPAMRVIVDEGARWYYTNNGHKIVDAFAWIDDARKAENRRREEAGGGEPPLEPCSRSTVKRAIAAIECRDTLVEKFGEAWYNRRYRISGAGLHTTRLLELCLIDDQMLDAVMVLDADARLPVGRPWICLIVDVHTRCVLGWYIAFQAPTLHSAVETVKRACRPKEIKTDRLARYPVLRSIYGLPSVILADNGSGYASPGFEDALLDVGSGLRLAAVRTPTHKAIIERIFLSLVTMLTSKLPGATVAPELARELQLDPTKDAVLTIAELDDLITEWAYLHHVTVHSALGMPPARAWELSAMRHGINVLDDARKLDQYAGDVHRVRLARNGFTIKGHRWCDRKALEQLVDDLGGTETQKRKGTFAYWVKVKINTADLGEAHVWNPRTNRYVTVRSATPPYSDGLSLYQHQQIVAWAKAQGLAFNSQDERLSARAELNRRILELAPDVAIRERKAMARMLASPTISERQGTVPVEQCDPRHDGMGAIVEVGSGGGAEEREDGGALSSRPEPARTPEQAKSPLDAAIEAEGSDADDDWDDLEADEEADALALADARC